MNDREKSKLRYRLLLFFPACFLILLVVIGSIGKTWVQIAKKYDEKRILDEMIISLKEKEEALKVDVDRLNDPDYIARYAREKYMYSKDGEIILRLPEDE